MTIVAPPVLSAMVMFSNSTFDPTKQQFPIVELIMTARELCSKQIRGEIIFQSTKIPDVIKISNSWIQNWRTRFYQPSFVHHSDWHVNDQAPMRFLCPIEDCAMEHFSSMLFLSPIVEELTDALICTKVSTPICTAPSKVAFWHIIDVSLLSSSRPPPVVKIIMDDEWPLSHREKYTCEVIL